MLEIWKDIPGYEGLYLVSEDGEVYSYATNRILKSHTNNRGYVKISLTKDKKTKSVSLHRIVLSTFSNDIQLLEINHINGIKSDNRLVNLEWCTKSQNMQHAYNILGVKRNYLDFNKEKGISKLSMDGELLKKYSSIKEASEETKIHKTHISQICRGIGKSAGGFMWKFS